MWIIYILNIMPRGRPKKNDPEGNRSKSEPPPLNRNVTEQQNVVNTAQSDVNEQPNDVELVQNQINLDDIGSGTSRSFGLYNNNEFPDVNIFDYFLNSLITTNISPERGTPQKRLHDLLVACDTIVKNDETRSFGKVLDRYGSEIELRIGQFATVSREDMLKDGRGVFIEEYINLFLSVLLSKKDVMYRSKVIMLLWSIIMVKSISDISQCGSFVNDIPNIIPKVRDQTVTNTQSVADSGSLLTVGNSITASSSSNIISSLSRDSCRLVNDRMKDNLNLCFVSSDGSCAAFSTNVLKLIEYPIPILHSRKTGKTTQTMILQKSEISVLSVILSLANENTYDGAIDDFITTILSNTQHLGKDGDSVTPEDVAVGINTMFSKIYELTRNYYQKLVVYYQNKRNDYVDTQPPLNILVQQEVDEMFRETNYNVNRKELLCELIHNISRIDSLVDYLRRISLVLSFDNKDINVPRWAYHISNDVFKYLFPLSNETRNLKEEISLQEILSATADAMYCHDFQLECLHRLGDLFLKSIGQNNLYDIELTVSDGDNQKNKSYDDIEKECIRETLAVNYYSTLNQHGDYFEICFDSFYNFIKRDKNEAGYRNAQVPWNIGFSPFVKTPLVAAIDFTIGEATFSSVFIDQINQINKIRNERYLLPFASIDNRAELQQKIVALKQYTKLFEYCGVTTLYDGAAPYGAFPLVFSERYETIINITEVGQYKIITQTTKSDEDITREWIESKFTLINLDLLSNYIRNLSEDEKNKFVFPNPPNKNYPYYFFNLIWGTILNSNPKLTSTYKGVINSEYNRIITDVLNKIERLERNESSSRAQRNVVTKYATGSNDFDDYKKFGSLKQELEDIKISIKDERNDKFDRIMKYYIQRLANISNEDQKEQANTLLKILELAVFNKSNESIDADVFMGLNSNILQQHSRLLNEGQQNIVEKLRDSIKEVNKLNKMAIDQKKNIEEVVKRSSVPLQLSGVSLQQSETDNFSSQPPNTDYMNLDPNNQLFSSAPAVMERKKRVPTNNTEESPVRQPTFASSSDVSPEEIDIQGNQNSKTGEESLPPLPITMEDFNSSPSSSAASTRRSSPEKKVAKKSFNMPPPSFLARSYSDPNTSIFTREESPSGKKRTLYDQDKLKGPNGGSRKNYFCKPKFTRRKNKKSPKRKTIKKRKMPKRNAKTRRQRK